MLVVDSLFQMVTRILARLVGATGIASCPDENLIPNQELTSGGTAKLQKSCHFICAQWLSLMTGSKPGLQIDLKLWGMCRIRGNDGVKPRSHPSFMVSVYFGKRQVSWGQGKTIAIDKPNVENIEYWPCPKPN